MMYALIISNVLAWLCIFALSSRLRACQNGLLMLLREKQDKIIKDFQENLDTFLMDMHESVSEAVKKADKKTGKRVKIERE